MTSWLTLKNSFSLFRFYVNDTLKGILNRPFFQMLFIIRRERLENE